MNQSVLRNIVSDGLVDDSLHDYKDVIMDHLPTGRSRHGGATGLGSPFVAPDSNRSRSDMGFNYQKDREAKLNASLQRFEVIQEAREKKVKSSIG